MSADDRRAHPRLLPTLGADSSDPRREPLTRLFRKLADRARFTAYCEYPERKLIGARMRFPKDVGDGHWDLIRIGRSLYVIVANVAHKRQRVVSAPSEGLISFHVRLSGEADLYLDQSNVLRISAPSLLVWHQPPGAVSVEGETARQRAEYVTLFCNPKQIGAMLGEDAHSVSLRLSRFLDSLGGDTRFQHLPIDAEIMAAAQALCRSPFGGRLKLLHAEAKSLELICLILAAADRLGDFVREQYAETDLQRLQKARAILASEFNPIPSTAALARRLGLNETKLKRGFKALFGVAVHEFGHNCRMQHALHLLRDQRLMIRRVATDVGYTHQTTFANSFKKHFGYRPKDVRHTPVADLGKPRA